MADNLHEFEINRSKLVAYHRVRFGMVLVPILAIVVFAHSVGFPMSAMLPLDVLLLVIIGLIVFWAPAHVGALRYSLEGTTLRVDEGLLLQKRKSIPLDRVTDLLVVSGPLMCLFGVWRLEIQTAGSAQQAAEGVLHGLSNAESVRDLLMAQRDSVAKVMTGT